MNVKKIQDEYTALCREEDALLEKTRQLKEQREPVNRERHRLAREVKKLTAEIDAIEQPRLHTLKMRKGKLARILQALREAER